MQLSDAMEVMLLAVLSPIIKCDWELDRWQQAMLTSVSRQYLIIKCHTPFIITFSSMHMQVVFVGFFFGGLSWGFLTDAVGRRMVIINK